MTEQNPPPSVAQPIQVVAELFTGRCTALWATTYNVDLHLFNEFLLPRLGNPPLNVVVLADQHRLARSLDRVPPERVDTLATVNRRWLLRGVRAGGAAFHPKTYLFVQGTGVTLLVGSGNLSAGGIDDGQEVFTAFHAGTPEGDAAIATWRSWMRRLVITVADTTVAERFTALEEQLSALPVTTSEVESPLLHNLDVPIVDHLLFRLRPQIAGRADELLVTAPFFDADAQALGRLIDGYRPRRIRLFLTGQTSVNGEKLRQRLESCDASIEVSFYQPEQFVHAKLVGVVAGTRAWLLSGSANLSRAALMHPAGHHGNYEMAVLTAVDPASVPQMFLPPNTTTANRPLAELASLSYEPDPEPTAAPVALLRAVVLGDGRLEVTTDPPPEESWLLSDLSDFHILGPHPGVDTAVSEGPVPGRLVEILDAEGDVISNRVIVDDAVALSQALTSSPAGSEHNRPAELTAADLDNPLGSAITWLHRNLVMDVTEWVSAASTGGVSSTEASEQANDVLWERLEREQLARDPRTDTYSRMWRAHSMAGGDPMIELLEAFSGRAPTAMGGPEVGSSILAEVIRLSLPTTDSPETAEEAEGRPSRRWKPGTRIRVRARNALRRWAAAQTDPRLAWVDPLAPAGNFTMIATTFVRLRLDIALNPYRVELTEDDLDDLWVRWLAPFVGTGSGDGWLDRQPDSAQDQVHDRLTNDLPEMVAALVWLVIRPRPDHRRRVIELQPAIIAADKHGLLQPTNQTAQFLTAVTGTSLSRATIERDLRKAQQFLDDDLWCQRLAAELDLPSISIKPSPGAPHIQVRLEVDGIEDPRIDPRVPRLVIEAQHYRGCDGVAIYAGNRSWRLVIPQNKPAGFMTELGDTDLSTSTPVSPEHLESLVSSSGVLADLFPSAEAA